MSTVPDKKLSRARTSRRHQAFVTRAQRQLRDQVALEKCPECNKGNPTEVVYKLRHHACPTCGMYKGRQIIKDKGAAKVTTIKA